MINILNNFTGFIKKSDSYQLLAIIYGDAIVGGRQISQCQWVISAVYESIEVLAGSGFIVPLKLSRGNNIFGDIDEVAAGIIDGVICNGSSSIKTQAAIDYLMYHFDLKGEQKQSVTGSMDTVGVCLKYFEEHIDEPIRLDDISLHIKKTKIAIIKAFKRDQGVAPMQVLAQMKILRATSLLEKNNLSVTQVANEVGFADLATFSHFYKRHTGKTPRQIMNAVDWVL